MRKILVLALIITSLAASAVFAADTCCEATTNCCNLTAQAPATPLEQPANAQTTTGLIPPPPIYTPFGGTVVTELNLSDADILGIVKQVIPAVGQALRDDETCKMLGTIDPNLSALGKIDFNTLIDAVNGIKNVRFIVVRYNRNLDIKQLQSQFDSGVAKVGTYSKIVSDISNPYGGVAAVYSQPSDGGGIIAYFYEPGARQLVAARVVGSLDYEKLTKWVIETGKLFYCVNQQTIASETDAEPETETETD